MHEAFPTPESLILWDVVQEHLDEAGFCFGVWQAALRSPLYTLAEVEAGPEERLRAHLDGLVIAGEPAVGRLLAPTLFDQEDVEPGAPQAAALALALLGRLDLLQAALLSERPEVRAATAEALALTAPAGLDAWLMLHLEAAPPGGMRGELSLLALRRGLRVAHLCSYATEGSIEELVAALISARREGERASRGPWDELLTHPDSGVAQQARRTGLYRGSEEAWRHTLAAAQAGSPEALLDLALFGEGGELDLLGALLEDPVQRVPALRAVGYSGRADLVPRLMEMLDDADVRVSRLAGEAVSLLTGLDLAEDPYNALPPADGDGLPEFEQDDLEADLVPSDDEDLPLPAAEAVRAWWARKRMTSPLKGRVLAGEPWSEARALDLLERGPSHRRATLAWWLDVRSGGRVSVDTLVWAAAQRRQVGDLRRDAREDVRARSWD